MADQDGAVLDGVKVLQVSFTSASAAQPSSDHVQVEETKVQKVQEMVMRCPMSGLGTSQIS